MLLFDNDLIYSYGRHDSPDVPVDALPDNSPN